MYIFRCSNYLIFILPTYKACLTGYVTNPHKSPEVGRWPDFTNEETEVRMKGHGHTPYVSN